MMGLFGNNDKKVKTYQVYFETDDAGAGWVCDEHGEKMGLCNLKKSAAEDKAKEIVQKIKEGTIEEITPRLFFNYASIKTIEIRDE